MHLIQIITAGDTLDTTEIQGGYDLSDCLQLQFFCTDLLDMLKGLLSQDIKKIFTRVPKSQDLGSRIPDSIFFKFGLFWKVLINN